MCGCQHAAHPPIIIGAIYNLSGIQKALDEPSYRGAKLAVAGANLSGGVRRSPVHLAVADGRSDPAVVAEQTEKLLQKHPSMFGVVGLSDSDMVLAAGPVAQRHERIFITSGATSPLLPDQVPRYLFLACFSDDMQAAAGAEWAYQKLGARTVAVLFDSTTEYTRLLPRYFQARFEQLGGFVKAASAYNPSSLDQAVTQLPAADLIYLAAKPEEVADIIARIRKTGPTSPILGGDSFDLGIAWKKHPDIDGVYFTTHIYLGADNPNPRVQAFRKAYLKAYPHSEPDAFAALGYDAANLLMQAIEQPLRADPKTVLETLTQIQEIEGVTGTLTFNYGQRIPRKPVTILRVDRGRVSLVEVVTPDPVPSTP